MIMPTFSGTAFINKWNPDNPACQSGVLCDTVSPDCSGYVVKNLPREYCVQGLRVNYTVDYCGTCQAVQTRRGPLVDLVAISPVGQPLAAAATVSGNNNLLGIAAVAVGVAAFGLLLAWDPKSHRRRSRD